MIPEIKKNLFNAKLDAIKIGLIMILAIFLVPLTINAVAGDYTDDFDNYGSIFDFYYNSDWTVSFPGTMFLQQTYFKSFPTSLVWLPTNYHGLWKQTTLQDYFSLKFYFLMDSFPTLIGAGTQVDFYDDTGFTKCFQIYIASFTATDTLIILGNAVGVATTSVSIPTGWVPIEVQFQPKVGYNPIVRFKFNDGFWSDWFPSFDNCSGVYRIYWVDAPPGENNSYLYYEIFWDSFSYQYGEGIPGICGIDDNCVFCETQTSCEDNNCFWIENVPASNSVCVPTIPYIEEIASSTFNATSFHEANCKYATATSLYTGLTSASGGMLEYLSSWLKHFENLFDLTQAREKGVEFGEAIPKARGYLEMFNGLFGYFPIGEVLLIYLVILIAIIIFRIVRHIKSLLPFQ